MTTDQIQDKQIRLKMRVTPAASKGRNSFSASSSKSGLELTRMQRFVDGGYDIFDVLEHHAANTQMKIKTRNTLEEKENAALPDSNLFKSLMHRLREQMREII